MRLQKQQSALSMTGEALHRVFGPGLDRDSYMSNLDPASVVNRRSTYQCLFAQCIFVGVEGRTSSSTPVVIVLKVLVVLRVLVVLAVLLVLCVRVALVALVILVVPLT